MFNKISERIKSYRNQMIEMQKGLTAIPAIAPESGGKGEYARGKYLEPFLRSVFDEVKELHAKDERAEGGIRPNYAAIYKGKSSEKTIWIAAHIDTVPPGDEKQWDTNPFEAVEKEEKLYGRGVEDNQQAVVSGFYAVKALKEEGIKPHYNIGFLLLSDEEVADEYGARHVFKNYKDIFSKDDLFIVPDAGDPKGETVEIAEKAFIWLKFTVIGKTTHGAYPHKGVNAHKASAHLIVDMEKLYKIYSKKDPIFPEHSSTFEPTLKITTVANYNTIPGEDIIGYDCRLLPSVDPSDFLKSVREICDGVEAKCGVKINMEIADKAYVAPPTPSNSPIVRLVKKAIKDVNGINAKVIGEAGMTIAQRFRENGFHAVAYSRIGYLAHQVNEYCVIDNMVNDATIWAHVFLNAK